MNEEPKTAETPSAPEPAQSTPVPADTDNFEAFEKVESFGEVDSPAPGADPAEAGSAAESEEGAKPSEEEAKEKEGKSAQERIDELTASAREAERRAAEAERLLAARVAAEEAKPPEEATPPRDGLMEGEPDPKDFAKYPYGEADANFLKDSSAFHARMEFRRQQAIQSLTSEFENIDKGYSDRVEQAVERYPDFQEKVEQGAKKEAWKATPVMALAMKTSEVGPDVAYHLATNPKESERIAALSPLEQAREMGRLDGMFMYKEKPVANRVSNAPPPPTNLSRGDGGKFTVDPATDNFDAFDRTYKSKASGN